MVDCLLLIVVQTWGWFIKQRLSRFGSYSLSIRPALLWSLHHTSSQALKSSTIIDRGFLVSGVVISSSPFILYILCHLLSVFVPLPPMVLYVLYHCYHTMSSFRYCSMVGVKIILYDSGIDCRRLCIFSVCVPMYQLDVGNCSVCSVFCCGAF